jgi:16S rRNA (guanine527-N7)-methyltransferase
LFDRPLLAARLDAGLDALSLPLEAKARARLLDYLELLAKWNATYNLTAIRDPLAMVDKHLLDSLAIAPFVGEAKIADLGTGPGLPGIPLAIAHPDQRVLLVESNGKKARFLREAVRQVGIPNAEAVEARAEAASKHQPVDAVVARALASIEELCRLARDWLTPDDGKGGGRLYAMKGPGVDAELASLPADFVLDAFHHLQVPGLDADRNLVVLRKAPV